jgi:hypothetical protein
VLKVKEDNSAKLLDIGYITLLEWRFHLETPDQAGESVSGRDMSKRTTSDHIGKARINRPCAALTRICSEMLRMK